jgi:hypothetical protein
MVVGDWAEAPVNVAAKAATAHISPIVLIVMTGSPAFLNDVVVTSLARPSLA